MHYDDIVYNQPNNVTFHGKQESVQYYTAVTIPRAIKGSPCEKNIQGTRFLNI